MSIGSPIVKFRCPRELLAEIELAIERHAKYSKCEPLSLSAWVLRACEREIAHAHRSRKVKYPLPDTYDRDEKAVAGRKAHKRNAIFAPASEFAEATPGGSDAAVIGRNPE